MFGMGLPEIAIILVVALIFIGPKKLPDLAKSLGRAMGEFKKASNDLKSTFSMDDDPMDYPSGSMKQIQNDSKPVDALEIEADDDKTETQLTDASDSVDAVYPEVVSGPVDHADDIPNGNLNNNTDDDTSDKNDEDTLKTPSEYESDTESESNKDKDH